MDRYRLFIWVFVAGFACIIVLGNTPPAQLERWMLKLDYFGLTQAGRQERARINRIMHLPIAYKEKMVLVDKAVFIGATPDMVIMALGEPQKKTAGLSPEGKPSERWLYHFANDSRPTLLEFIDGQLAGARKISLADAQ